MLSLGPQSPKLMYGQICYHIYDVMAYSTNILASRRSGSPNLSIWCEVVTNRELFSQMDWNSFNIIIVVTYEILALILFIPLTCCAPCLCMLTQTNIYANTAYYRHVTYILIYWTGKYSCRHYSTHQLETKSTTTQHIHRQKNKYHDLQARPPAPLLHISSV